jgi:hypothetical protein
MIAIFWPVAQGQDLFGFVGTMLFDPAFFFPEKRTKNLVALKTRFVGRSFS